jgi:hypothetical protein
MTGLGAAITGFATAAQPRGGWGRCHQIGHLRAEPTPEAPLVRVVLPIAFRASRIK